jgi:hypothetical protein
MSKANRQLIADTVNGDGGITATGDSFKTASENQAQKVAVVNYNSISPTI